MAETVPHPLMSYRYGMTTPPSAPQRPLQRVMHGETRNDPYAWLSDRNDSETIEYLTAENAYANDFLSLRKGAADALFEEIRGKIQEADQSVPVRHRSFEYWSATATDQQYVSHHRRRVRLDGNDIENAPLELLIDVNTAAEGHDFFDLGILSIAPSEMLLALGSDTEGNELYRLRFISLDGTAAPEEVLEDIGSSVIWSADSKYVFYLRVDTSLRPFQVWRHELGTSVATDVCIFEETDEQFAVDIGGTKSDAWIVMVSASSTSTESWTIPTAAPLSDPVCFAPRRTSIEYEIDHHPGSDSFPPTWVIAHNDAAPDGCIATCPIDDTTPERWVEVLPHLPGTRRMGFDLTAYGIAVAERENADTHIRLLDLRDGSQKIITGGPATAVVLLGSEEFDAPLRYVRTSLTQPRITIDRDLETDSETVRKIEPVLGGFESSNYLTERHWATASDGTKIPLSIARHRDTPLDGTAPCLLYGYGSYEISIDPSFNPGRLSLLDRGVIYVIAHVRGGGELGRSWYEDGKFGNKHHSFSDFVSAAEYLFEQQFTSAKRLAIRGRSAGGLLIGGTLNLRPDLCAVASLEVPFVDALTTMLDASLPLTTVEYEEWGNPNDIEGYRWIRSYSPIDNLHDDQTYPSLYITGGLHDPRVGYWEPAKYVATIRERITCRGPVLLRTEMGAGHMGPSGRFDALREEAEVLRFLLDQIGVAQ